MLGVITLSLIYYGEEQWNSHCKKAISHNSGHTQATALRTVGPNTKVFLQRS